MSVLSCSITEEKEVGREGRREEAISLHHSFINTKIITVPIS